MTTEQAYQTPEEAAANSAAASIPEGLWPEGSYTGVLIRANSTASAQKGTPGLQLYFQVNGTKEVCVECWISEASLGAMTGDQLRVVKWNGEFENPEFDPPESVPLWMKHDTYKGKTRERWNISAVAQASPAAIQSLDRARQLWKAKGAAPAPVPATAPKAPPRVLSTPAPTPAPKPAAATSPPKAPPKAPPKPAAKAPPKPAAPPVPAERRATNQDEAWAVWCEAKAEDADAFWNAVSVAAPDISAEDLTPEHWQAVANAAPPF